MFQRCISEWSVCPGLYYDSEHSHQVSVWKALLPHDTIQSWTRGPEVSQDSLCEAHVLLAGDCLSLRWILSWTGFLQTVAW